MMKLASIILPLLLGPASALASACKPSSSSASSTAASTSTATTTSTSASATPTCGVNIVDNPQFDDSLDGWTTSGAAVWNVSVIAGCSASYDHCAQIQIGSGSATISQTLDTVAGSTYSVDLAWELDQSGLEGMALNCDVDNSAGTSWSAGPTSATGTWETLGGDFVATSDSTVFTCTADGPDDFTLFLSGIQIIADC